jgi:TPR repeat protein
VLADIRAKAEKGDAQSQKLLGSAFCFGRPGLAKDEAEGVKWLRKAAEQNDTDAQSLLALCYALGHGVAKDAAEAVKWCRKAAEQGNAEAQNSLGVCYYRGQGVAKDEAEAYKWFLLASAQGNEDATKAMTTLESGMSQEQIGEGQKLARNFEPERK